MKRIAIVTDSNSGITQAQAGELGVNVLPMPFTMDGESFFEDINLTQETFYQKLAFGAEIYTSQPSPGAVLDIWGNLLKDCDEIVHIPMSSGLSASCDSAQALSREFDGRVQVVDNRRISVTQGLSALEAKALAAEGKSAVEIKEILEQNASESSIYIMVDTLKYLKQGGRITPAAAAIGTVLNIKPVLQINGGKLDQFAKVRGVKQARACMLNAIRNDMHGRFADFCKPETMELAVVYSNDAAVGEEYRREAEEAFPGFKIKMAALSLSVACHIGPGALAMTCTKKIV